MASSTSSHVHQIKYDVFVSFRGTDIRYGFLSHLKKELRQKQVDAFVDDRLEGGDEITPALVEAIEGSLISLVIFSKDYASSKWCLEELVKIIECKERNKQFVIPVFYYVHPTDVRFQKGTYGDSFAEHEKKRRNMDKLQNWRSALNKAADHSGFDSSNFRDEVELIEIIVKCLSAKLNQMYQSESTGLVGIEERIADIESLLCLGSTTDVRVIGIWGMGGIGKTTIAEAVFNRWYFEYEGCCFMANIREESDKHGIVYMKNKIISILLQENDLHIGTPSGVPPYVKRRLLRKKVLLVLDDVNDSEQLENLVGALDWFGSGSRIIVTTRDKQVLLPGKIVDSIYEVKPLHFDEAVKLFILNAFKQSCHDMEWIELSRRVIKYANGNPLALKVLGSFLYRKTKIEWESQLQKLKKMPHGKVQKVLRLTYDTLDREEKNIFLYIACFLKGYESHRIIVLLDKCGLSTIIGLKVLQDKALIVEARGSGRSIVSMHDLIQEMGWEIVREESLDDPGKRSRLWDHDDIHQVLTNNMGTKAIKSITLNLSKFDELSLGPGVFSRMSQLKFLKFSQHYGDEKILYLPQGLESLPNHLRLLHWVSYPLKSLPLKAENIVELQLIWSRAEKLWDGIQSLEHLKRIDLSYSKHLLELPDFSKASNLEEMELFGCSNLLNVHPSILSLHKLVRLNLFDCKALTSLRSDSHLRSLRNLFLGGCSRLEEFSVTSEKMKDLNLNSTAISELPSAIGTLRTLETLTLDHCKSLNNLPNKVAELRSLRALYIYGCTQLDASNLHILCNGLVSLETLKMEKCLNLHEIPDNISLLSSLRELLLTATDVERFPASIKHLSKLEKLDIRGCKRLHSLPELPPSIIELHATNCSSLEAVMFTSNAAELLQVQACKTHITFQNCMKLDEPSLNAVGVVYGHANMQKHAYEHLLTIGSKFLDRPVAVIYPGSEVPQWFMNKTTQASVTVDLSCAPRCKVMGFILCAIVGKFSSSDDNNFIGCDCYLDNGNGEENVDRGDMSLWSSIAVSELFSDHVCMWYDERFCAQNRECNDESMEELMGGHNNPKVSFRFFAQTGSTWEKRNDIMIKGCGVCPMYDSEYHSFVKQMELELGFALQSKATGIPGACTDQKETLPAKQQSNCKEFIFPPLPIGIWKSATQGLRDILLL